MYCSLANPLCCIYYTPVGLIFTPVKPTITETSVFQETSSYFSSSASQKAGNIKVSNPWALTHLSVPSAQLNKLPESHCNLPKSQNNTFTFCRVLQAPYISNFPAPCTPTSLQSTALHTCYILSNIV